MLENKNGTNGAKFTYVFSSTWSYREYCRGRESGEESDITFKSTDASRWLISNANDILKEELEEFKLTQYFDEPLNKVCIALRVELNSKEAITEIDTTRELTDTEIETLKDNILGQFSDGYGEGFEQQEAYSWIDRDTYYYEEEDEDGEVIEMSDVEDIECADYVSLYNYPDNTTLKLVGKIAQ